MVPPAPPRNRLSAVQPVIDNSPGPVLELRHRYRRALPLRHSEQKERKRNKPNRRTESFFQKTPYKRIKFITEFIPHTSRLLPLHPPMRLSAVKCLIDRRFAQIDRCHHIHPRSSRYSRGSDCFPIPRNHCHPQNGPEHRIGFLLFHQSRQSRRCLFLKIRCCRIQWLKILAFSPLSHFANALYPSENHAA